MRESGPSWALPGKQYERTTVSDEAARRPSDLFQRRFGATRPDQLWVADLTYVPTWSGFAYVPFITDVYSRRIVGWPVSNSL
ncbi:MAG: DDE-type integrase/transposase/recombinase [Myxococcota bacterium]